MIKSEDVGGDDSMTGGGEAGVATTKLEDQPSAAAAAAVTDAFDPLPRASELLFASNTESKLYWDRSHYGSPESQMKALAKSSTLYIGNLAFSTRSHHILGHFSQVGPVSRIVMGLDRFHHTPCGFCFIEYELRNDALSAIANLNATKLDGRVIRVELDAGFQPGRQYGRGASGGQVRDDRRRSTDPGRNKKQKTANFDWTPPDQVAQQQEGGAGVVSPIGVATGTTGGDVEGAATTTAALKQEGDLDMGQESSNPRFRDES